MKRILSAAAALSVFAFAQQAQAADFILSNNTSNLLNEFFKFEGSNGVITSASLKNTPGIAGPFSDRFIFAPSIAGFGDGQAGSTLASGLIFDNPGGVSIAGYALTVGVGAALLSAFGALDYTATGTGDLGTLQAYLAGPPAVLYSQASLGTGVHSQVLNNVPLNPLYFYVISITGSAGNTESHYTGTLDSVAVPEPATWALMLAGFGAIGFAMRRQRKAQPKVRFAF